MVRVGHEVRDREDARQDSPGGEQGCARVRGSCHKGLQKEPSSNRAKQCLHFLRCQTEESEAFCSTQAQEREGRDPCQAAHTYSLLLLNFGVATCLT